MFNGVPANWFGVCVMAVKFIKRGGRFLKNSAAFVRDNEDCCCGESGPCASHPNTLYCHVTCGTTTSTFAITEQAPGGFAGRWWQGSGAISGTGTLIVCVSCSASGGELRLNYDACTGYINDCRDQAQPPDGTTFPISRTAMPPPGNCGCGSGPFTFTVDETP